MIMRPNRALMRLTAVAGAMMLLLVACGGSDNGPEEPPAEADEQPAESDGDETSEAEEADPQVQAAQRHELYYPPSELFLPNHPINGLNVDFYATLEPLDDTIAWFEDNIDELHEYAIEDAVVEGERRWVADRPDATAEQVQRIEIAHSVAHANIGLIAPISDVLPPDTVIIAIAYGSD